MKIEIDADLAAELENQTKPETLQSVVVRHALEIMRLRTALEAIANPISAMRERAKREGAILNGQMAVAMSNNADYLKNIAREALNGNSKSTPR